MISASTSLPTPVSPSEQHVDVGRAARFGRAGARGASRDRSGRRPTTARWRRRVPGPARRRARSGRRRSARRAERTRRPSGPRRVARPRRVMRAPNSTTRLSSCSNRIISYSSGPYAASTSPGRTCGDAISATVSRRRPGRDVQPQDREHPPGRRRLLALLLQAALEIGVRRDAPHPDDRPPALDHQRRPADRDRLARQHRHALAPASSRSPRRRVPLVLPRSSISSAGPTCSRA